MFIHRTTRIHAMYPEGRKQLLIGLSFWIVLRGIVQLEAPPA